jgi:hypothetical protein
MLVLRWLGSAIAPLEPNLDPTSDNFYLFLLFLIFLRKREREKGDVR